MIESTESTFLRRGYVVRGRVQGVGFRAFVAAAGRELGLKGWVRNLPDGTVQAVAEGSPEAVGSFEIELSHGPALSRVEGVTECACEGDLGPFTIRM